MVKTKVENLRKKVTQLDATINKTLGRIENKIDSLIGEYNAYQLPSISISFKSYEEFEKAINSVYTTNFPFETIGFKCMTVNQAGEDFFREQGYKFERINVKEYFSKKNKKHLFHEFHNYINAKYKKTKKYISFKNKLKTKNDKNRS